MCLFNVESNTNTVWIGEKSEIVKIINSDYYSPYGTVITQDSSILKSDNTTYKWGITNNEIQTMADLAVIFRHKENLTNLKHQHMLIQV